MAGRVDHGACRHHAKGDGSESLLQGTGAAVSQSVIVQKQHPQTMLKLHICQAWTGPKQGSWWASHLIGLGSVADVQGVHDVEDHVCAGIHAHGERDQAQLGCPDRIEMTAQGPVSAQAEPPLRRFEGALYQPCLCLRHAAGPKLGTSCLDAQNVLCVMLQSQAELDIGLVLNRWSFS